MSDETMAVPALSENDFQCLQNQLLELRTKNYGLEEKNAKYLSDLKQAHLYIEELRTELARVQKVIQRSKNARERDLLLQENERLQGKLQSQEDEFRLQNQTLMQEIITLTSVTDDLKKELEIVKSDNSTIAEKEMFDGLLRLQAENAALKKKLHINKSHENEEGDIVKEEEIEPDLKKEVELEENELLKNKLYEAQKLHKEEILRMQNETEKLVEKLRKKQESMMQLHEEKEKMYTEFQASLKELQNKNSDENQMLKQQIQNLERQIKYASKSLKDESISISSLTEQSFDESEAKVELISGERASFECSLNDSKQRFRDLEEKLICLTEQCEDLQLTVKKLEDEKSLLRQKNQALEEEKLLVQQQNQMLVEEKEKLNADIMEKTTLAEKRKNLIEEMNNDMLETTNKHSKEIDHLLKQLAEEQDALQKLFDKERETRLELVQSHNEVKHLKQEIESLKKEHSTTHKDLIDVQGILEETKQSCEKQLQELKSQHEKNVEEFEERLKTQSDDLTIQIEVARAEKTEFEEKVITLEQEVKDLHDEKKIVEKKNACMVKDLKRQLLVERKRAEKLQERLQEVLNEQNRSVEEILQSSNASDKPKGDASSVSSWSYVSAEAADRENPSHSDGSSCGRESPSCLSPSALENETTNLLEKVTHLQQKNWILEEKVNHLEMSNEALVDDLLKKTAIIQFYCMEGRSNTHLAASGQDKLTIKRILDFIKDKGDENLKEINRKMQRMLEETLTKNMHLQKDIETLSNEVSRLSKIMQTSVDQNMQSAVFVDGI